MTVPRRQYRHPPIEEALCEFRFEGGAEWEAFATPSRIGERLAHSYPGKARLQHTISAAVHPQGQAPGPALEMTQGPQRVQFPTADGKKLVSVGPGVLSIHVLRPYTGWEDFLPRISQALSVYEGVCQPRSVVRVGVRYINRISLAGGALNLGDYFEFLPVRPPGLPSTLASFLHRNEFVYEDGVKLVMTFASIPSDSASSDFLLDVDVILEGKEPRPVAEALHLAEDLRVREREAFEATITDKLRDLFDAD